MFQHLHTIFYCVLFFCFIRNSIQNESSQYVSIEGTLVIPTTGARSENIQITLNGMQYSTNSRHDGSFEFPFIPSGIYTLDVLSIHDIFPQMKLKVNATDGVINVVEYKYPGSKRLPSTHPLVITAISPITYFQRKAPLSLTGMIFGNPMVMIMIVSLGVMMYFPNLLQGIDPQQMKELQQEMNANGDPMKNFKKLVGMEERDNQED